VQNKFKESNAIKDKTSGIGLTNVRRRLALLYPGSHELTIKKEHDEFLVYLKLALK
jgi:two-component system, LytTR family, sensor kinase